RVTIEMRPSLNGGAAGTGSPKMVLAPKAQKELGKALEALRANKPEAARGHLDAAYRLAPNHPAVNYLFGVYFLQMNDGRKPNPIGRRRSSSIPGMFLRCCL